MPPAAPRPMYPVSDPARFGNIEAKYILQNPLIHLDLHAVVCTVKFKKEIATIRLLQPLSHTKQQKKRNATREIV